MLFDSEVVRTLLKSNKVTQKDLAEAIGITTGGMSDALNNGSTKQGTIEKIAKYFQIEPEALIVSEAESNYKKSYTQKSRVSVNAQGRISTDRTAMAMLGIKTGEITEDPQMIKQLQDQVAELMTVIRAQAEEIKTLKDDNRQILNRLFMTQDELFETKKSKKH